MSRIVIQGAKLIDYRNHYDLKQPAADLYLKDGKIEGVNLGGEVDKRIDAKGLVLTPALIDLHAHLREPGQEDKEDLTSGLSAAASGGYGTVVSMANTKPPIDSPEVVRSLIAKAEKIGQARLRPAATLSRGLQGKELTDFAALKEAGVVMMTDDGIPVQDSHLMRRACEYAKELDLVIQTHSEEPSLRKAGVMHEGLVSQQLGLPGNPSEAEAIMIFRDCEIARMTGAKVHIAHITSKRGMQVVEWFKAQGFNNITAEVTPNHLTLTDEVLRNFDPIAKVAPPLRTEEDRLYLIGALKRGVVDHIGTDHAPHTRAEKERDMLEAPFGIANLEVSFALVYSELVINQGMNLAEVLAHFHSKPAKIMNWPLPSLATDEPADLVLLDLEQRRVVRPESFLSKAKFSPWAAQQLQGWPMMTFVRGEKVYEHERTVVSL
ncbi:MAG: dihydroorotase [Deinococcales bacterium]